MLMSPKTSNIQDVLDAALRLLVHKYIDWTKAGGRNECDHGIAEGIACRRCDETTVLHYQLDRHLITGPDPVDASDFPDPGPAVHKYIDRHKYVPAPFGSRRP